MANETNPSQRDHLTVGVVFGGRSVEHQVSVASARTVAAALEEAGHRVEPLGIAPDGGWTTREAARQALDGTIDALPEVRRGAPVAQSLAGELERLGSVDAVFPIVHGTWGEDGTLQGLCEMLDLPYAGPDVTCSAVCMDKALAKEVLHAAGLPVVPWETVRRHDFVADPEAQVERCRRFDPPVFVKPSVGGSSVGVRKVVDAHELEDAIAHALRFDERVVVEKGIEGRELECAVLGYGDLEASGVGEIVPGKDFYDYADKYVDDGAELIHHADLDDDLRQHLRRLAVDAFAAVGGAGMARVDFLLDDEGPRINEINTLPGFTAISMYPKLWQLAGLQPSRLVDRLVRIAVERHADRRRLDEGIKDWITSLG